MSELKYSEKEQELIAEIVDKTEKLKAMGLDMNTIKRLLVENFKVLRKFPPTVGEFGTEYEVLEIAESGMKLSKLKNLKGIKPYGAIPFGVKKIKCQYFILGNDCYVKHMDYFSCPIEYDESDCGADLNTLCEKYMDKNRAKKFVYSDAWGEVIMQRKAWIQIKNFVFACDNMHPVKVRDLILMLQEKFHAESVQRYELQSTDFDRFWEELVNDYRKKAMPNLSEEERWKMYMDGLQSIGVLLIQPDNLKQRIETCKEVMMIWSLEQDIVPAILNKKGFPMFFDEVIRDVYMEKAENEKPNL